MLVPILLILILLALLGSGIFINPLILVGFVLVLLVVIANGGFTRRT